MHFLSVPCGGILTKRKGTILSPGYPDYPNLQMCAWTITVEKGYNISMFFEFFQTEKEFDILEVFDGNYTIRNFRYYFIYSFTTPKSLRFVHAITILLVWFFYSLL
uniref:CUB domain-containing protein n=1 Tax=Crocodylus porosus TaxID=8502 RepID=A0A7M4EI43_CROPO